MMWGWGYPGTFNGDYWWISLIAMALHALFWVAIIWFGVSLFRKAEHRSEGPNYRSSAGLEILRERYAKGEIDTDEFNRKKQELGV